MRKGVVIVFSSVLVFVLVMCAGCGQDGSGGNKKLLSLFPGDAAGIVSLDFKSLSSFIRKDIFDSIIKEAEKKKPGETEKNFDYKEFVAKTGIEPHKHVHGIVFAFFEDLDRIAEKQGIPDILILVNLDFDSEKLLSRIKEKNKTTEESFNGFSLLIDRENQNMAVSFLDAGTMAIGAPEILKKVISRFKQTDPPPLPDTGLTPYIKAFKPGVFASFALEIPGSARKLHEAGMYQVDLSKAEMLSGHLHISGDTPITTGAFSGRIELIRHDETLNKQLLTILNGVKAMAALGGPEAAEAAKHINLDADAEKVSLAFSFSTEIVEKLARMGPGGAGAPPTK